MQNQNTATRASTRGRILIVDDELSFTKLMKMNLEQAGYVVETVNRAKQALPAAQQFKPDMILLDVMMPDGSGGEVAETIEKDPALAHVPITFITAAVRKEELGNSGGMIGGRAFMAKPVKLVDLMEHIDKRIVKKAAPQEVHIDHTGRKWELLPSIGKFIDHFSRRDKLK